MSNAPKYFSVVIPLYNKAATVERAIKSVLNQTVQNFEIIVVNDGSSDNGQDIVSTINDSRVRLIQQNNQGVSVARNRGIAEAKNDLIAFLDADDEWIPEFLETIERMVLQYPDCALYSTRYFLQAPLDTRQPALVRGLPDNYEGILENYFEIAVRGAPPMWTSAVCAKKDALLEIDGFPVGVKSGEDLLTWARLAVRFKVAYSMHCLAIFYQTTAEICETAPSRVPEDDDLVCRGLAELLNIIEPDKKIFLQRYCALWHKMRASCYLRLNMKNNARNEILKSLNYSADLKLIAYWLLSFFPYLIIKKAFLFGASNR